MVVLTKPGPSVFVWGHCREFRPQTGGNQNSKPTITLAKHLDGTKTNPGLPVCPRVHCKAKLYSYR